MKLSDFRHGTIIRIGQTNYRLYRQEQFPNGLLGTMSRFARIQPCDLRGDGHWWDDHNAKWETRNWSDECELVDDSYTAVAGEIFDTRLVDVNTLKQRRQSNVVRNTATSMA